MSYSITHQLPVSPHVYKYLTATCGSDHIKASRKSWIGNLVLDIQTKDFKYKPLTSKMDHIFKVTITEHDFNHLGTNITPKSAKVFNKTIDMIFREKLYEHALIANRINGIPIMKYLEGSLEIYDITEDDLKFDTLYRDFKRKKDHILNLKQPKGQISQL